jgi:uncharacterized DUF497 family protein
MPIEFDPAKDATNQTKHGLSLKLAAGLDWEAARGEALCRQYLAARGESRCLWPENMEKFL